MVPSHQQRKKENNPLTSTTFLIDPIQTTFFDGFKYRYHIINNPIPGFKRSSSIWFAVFTSKKYINIIMMTEIESPNKARKNSFIKNLFKYFLKINAREVLLKSWITLWKAIIKKPSRMISAIIPNKMIPPPIQLW